MLSILSIILPVFIVLASGQVLKILNLIDEHFIERSNKLIFYFFLPVLLFNKIASSHFYDVFNLPNILLMYAIVLVVISLSYLTAYVIKLEKKETPTFVMVSFRGNVAYVGLPVCYYAWGDTALAIASIFMAFYTPLVNIISVFIMNGKRADMRIFIKEVFFNPLIISALLGIAFSFLSLNLPVFVGNSLDIISGVTMPLSLIAIGATMDFKRILGNKTVLVLNSIIKLLLMPFLVFIYFIFTQGSLTLSEQVLVIFMACPTAVATYIVAAGMDGDQDLASSTIIVSTILSLFTFIMWLGILR